MTLDEAIKHCEEVAEKKEEMCRIEELMGLGLQNAEMMKCAREHKQLAEWLRELKKYRTKNESYLAKYKKFKNKCIKAESEGKSNGT